MLSCPDLHTYVHTSTYIRYHVGVPTSAAPRVWRKTGMHRGVKTNLQGHGGARALGILVELDADDLAVGQARELVRVQVLEVVGLGREDDLAGPA